jgi:hypothetical protein
MPAKVVSYPVDPEAKTLGTIELGERLVLVETWPTIHCTHFCAIGLVEITSTRPNRTTKGLRLHMWDVMLDKPLSVTPTEYGLNPRSPKNGHGGSIRFDHQLFLLTWVEAKKRELVVDILKLDGKPCPEGRIPLAP